MNKKNYIFYTFLFLTCALRSLQASQKPRGILANIATPSTANQTTSTSVTKLTAPSLSTNNTDQLSTKNFISETTQDSSLETQISSITMPDLPPPPPIDNDTLQGKTKAPDDAFDNLITDTIKKEDSSNSDALTIVPPKDTIDTKTTDTTETNTQNKDANKKEEKPKLSSEEDKVLTEKLKKEEENNQLIRFYFEDATLENLVHYIEDLYKVKFFTDDDLAPTPQGGAILKGHKLTFKTNKPLNRTEAWSLFLKFMDMAGLSIVPGEVKNFYRITTITAANKEVIPTFFDTDVSKIPNNSQKVRYVFFAKNTPLATIQKIVSSFTSTTAGPIQTFPDLNALIVTDKGANIRSLMEIVQEFDREMPEAMSVLKLKRADAQEVANLYQSLTKAEDPKGIGKILAQRNQPKSLYFPADARIIPEPRTNALILLGSRKALNKIEEFIVKYVDVELDMPYSPLHIYELQYTQATNIASILNATATKFGSGTTVAQYGGVRDGNQYFGPMTITPDTFGNRLVIKAEENDYLKLKDVIQKLDIVQPQVVVEVLIVDVQTTNDMALGSQIRNKANGLVKNVDFQRSGLPVSSGFNQVINATDGSLLGNLVTLVASGAHNAGSTLLTVGNQASGVWGVLKMLEKTAKTDIISNPFLLTTNNYSANVTLGSTRRVQTTTVTTGGQTSRGNTAQTANLTVNITPQISSDGSVQMEIAIDIEDFSSSSLDNGDKLVKSVKTAAIVQNREVLVLGGLVKDKVTHNLNKVPILGSIPVLGWLFKSKTKQYFKSNLLIFISPQIIYPGMEKTVSDYMHNKADQTKFELNQAGGFDHSANKDPINRFFFDDRKPTEIPIIENFMKGDTCERPVEETAIKKKAPRKKRLAFKRQRERRQA